MQKCYTMHVHVIGKSVNCNSYSFSDIYKDWILDGFEQLTFSFGHAVAKTPGKFFHMDFPLVLYNE